MQFECILGQKCKKIQPPRTETGAAHFLKARFKGHDQKCSVIEHANLTLKP